MTELLKDGDHIYVATSDGRHIKVLKLKADTLEKVAEFGEQLLLTLADHHRMNEMEARGRRSV